MLAHAFLGNSLFVAQGHMPDARVALFTKPEDPTPTLEGNADRGDFHRVHAVSGSDGTIVFGENNGEASRIFAIRETQADQDRRRNRQRADISRRTTDWFRRGPHEIVLWRYDGANRRHRPRTQSSRIGANRSSATLSSRASTLCGTLDGICRDSPCFDDHFARRRR